MRGEIANVGCRWLLFGATEDLAGTRGVATAACQRYRCGQSERKKFSKSCCWLVVRLLKRRMTALASDPRLACA